MRTPSLAHSLRLALALLALTATACKTDDAAPPATDAATVDAASADGPPGATDAATSDAIGACNLPPAVIHCTVGNNAPCTAVCATAYCYNFIQVGIVCTKPCTVVGDCPTGWSCNMMGRCRPPG